LAKLSHQNIVSVFDFGQVDGQYYFVMEFVDGPNLRHLMETDGIQPDEALAIVPQICEALRFAHQAGVVRRDIKPENILIDKQRRVKIADFGLVKLLGRETEDSRLTGTRQAMGTLHYMAPEQMRGAASVDNRADIYSLGVVFYEMLTGELPIGRFAPPSTEVQVDVRLDEVVLRALAREPERRYQQASDVKTDVESIMREPKTAAVYPSNDESGSERVDQPISGTANVGREWSRRCALFVSAVGILSGLILEWTKTPGHLVPTILLACLFFFLLAAEGAGRVLWWWFLVVCYVGFAVAALAFAEGLAASGPLAVLLCGGVLVGVGAVEFGRRLEQNRSS
jgi:serine/threonine protein kinase